MIDPDAPLDVLTAVTRDDDTRFTAEIPDRWQQGRGCFGGLVLATITRAASEAVADPSRSLRTLTAELIGPATPGPAAIAVEILRAGSGVTTVAARLVQAGEVCAHAVLALGKPRAPHHSLELAPPALPPWSEVPVAPLTPPVAPVFTSHVEFRPTGGVPFSGRPSPETTGYVRFRRPGARRGDEFLVAMADCWWPAMLAAETTFRPAATLTFAYEAVGDLAGEDPDAPLAYRGRVLAAREGYAVETRELWTATGRLLVLNQQTFVVMK